MIDCRCDWLRMNRLIITRAVRHLATAAVGNAWWQYDLLQLRLDVVYLDIYLFYVCVGYRRIILSSDQLRADSLIGRNAVT